MTLRFNARLATIALTAAMAAAAVPAMAQVMVGGAPMLASKDIIDNAVNSKDHTTLVAAVKAAGLVETLKGPGPFTVFAPTNAAFAALPAGTVDALLAPFQSADGMKLVVADAEGGSATLLPVRGFKIGLSGTRHFAIANNPGSKKVLFQLNTGIQHMRKSGEIASAYRECGFFNETARRWTKLP